MRRASHAAALLALGWLAGCETGSVRFVYEVAADGSCDAASCADVALDCDAYLNFRVIRPSDPEAPFISFCRPVRINGDGDLCSIASIDLAPEDLVPLPTETLQVQVLVWPGAAVAPLPDGDFDCPGAGVAYDKFRGFPVVDTTAATPAIGGSTFFGPNDDTVVIELGCTDLSLISGPSCSGEVEIDVAATVVDFETRVTVGPSPVADRFGVLVGSPVPIVEEDRWVLVAGATTQLDLSVTGPVPAWSADIPPQKPLGDYVCIDVSEDTAEQSALTCDKAVPGATSLSLRGVRVPQSTVDDIVTALGVDDFPSQGLTVGIVVDYTGAPVEGAVVNRELAQNQPPDIRYLNATRTAFAGSATSASGIFISESATLTIDYLFAVADPANPTLTTVGIGGAVEGKVSVVILQLPQSIE